MVDSESPQNTPPKIPLSAMKGLKEREESKLKLITEDRGSDWSHCAHCFQAVTSVIFP